MNKKIIIFISVLFLCFDCNFKASFCNCLFKKSIKTKNDFSCTYSKFFTRKDFKKTSKKEYIWIQKSTKPFRELILSWNAFRPKRGKFSFFVSVKHNYWSNWYKIAEWGANSQQTFVNTKNPFVHVKHVRTELKRRRKALAFRIKVKAENGADIRKIKALFVCISKGNGSFKIEKPNINLPDVYVKRVPRQSQMVIKHKRAADLCSPTSISMIVNYFLKNKKICKSFIGGLNNYVRQIAKKIHDDSYLDIYGNWILNVAQAFDSAKGKAFFKVERLNNFSNLYNYLKNNIPVAVSVRGHLNGGAKTYENGHFVVVIGWKRDRKAVICLDPAFKGSRKIARAYNIYNFLARCGNSTSPNLPYVPIPRNFVDQIN